MPSASDVRTRVRSLLTDSSSPYRWSDTVIDGYVDSGVARVYALRPDAFLTTSGTIEAAPGTVTTLGDEWIQPLAEYAAGKALSEDSADVENVRMGEAHLAAFRDYCRGDARA